MTRSGLELRLLTRSRGRSGTIENELPLDDPFARSLLAGLDPDPLTIVPDEPPARRTTEAAWLTWTGAAIAVAVLADVALALVGFRGLELGAMMFAAGVAWSGLTPRVLRGIGRRVRG